MVCLRHFFFDLEGPLSPQDNALEIGRRYLPGGADLFHLLSAYDDLLVEEGRSAYEAGDTLALIAPFIALRADFSPSAIGEVSAATTTLTPGAQEVVTALVDDTSQYVTVISSSYRPHAEHVVRLLGAGDVDVHATGISSESLRGVCPPAARTLISGCADWLVEQLRLGKSASDIRAALDKFFFGDLAEIIGRAPNEIIQPCGGARKVAAMEEHLLKSAAGIADTAFVGDSITDAAVLRHVDAHGGLAIAFNANQYALECASIAVAGGSLAVVLPLLEVWRIRGRSGVETAARESPSPELALMDGLSAAEQSRVLACHRDYRLSVRSEAGMLG